MPELIFRKVKEWTTKDGGFHGLPFMDQNNNEFEFRNAPFPAISAEFPGVDLGIEMLGEVNPPLVQND